MKMENISHIKCIEILTEKYQMDEIIAKVYVTSLLDNENKEFLNNSNLDIYKKLENLKPKQVQAITNAFLLGNPRPGTCIGSLLVSKLFVGQQQTNLNAKRVGNNSSSGNQKIFDT